MPRQEATHAIDVKHVLRPRAAVDKAGIKLLGDYLINGFTKNWVDIGGQKKTEFIRWQDEVRSPATGDTPFFVHHIIGAPFSTDKRR